MLSVCIVTTTTPRRGRGTACLRARDSSADAAARERALRDGALDYLFKPHGEDALLDPVRETMR